MNISQGLVGFVITRKKTRSIIDLNCTFFFPSLTKVQILFFFFFLVGIVAGEDRLHLNLIHLWAERSGKKSAELDWSIREKKTSFAGMNIRYFLLIFFLSSISSCSADSVTYKNGTTVGFHGSSSGNLSLSISNFNDFENISSLNLSQKNITIINRSFWSNNWDSLTRLNLSLNNINQTLPEEIGNLTSLVNLSLSSNSFYGEIPFANLTKLKKLIELDLSRNQFNGSLNGGLVTNKLIGIANLSSLEHLSLSSNNLQGKIPQSISGLANLTYLDLSGNNNLTGPIIRHLSKIKPLEYLNLSGINLDLEKNLSSIRNLTKLSRLDLSNTNLSGVIPEEIVELKSLKVLDLSHNNLEGQIPDFSNTSNLTVLDLPHNNPGQVPNFANMTNLTELDLSHNNLIGNIPDFTVMRYLSVLDLSFNDLEGQIPDFSNMTDLTVLNLSHNNLSGRISDAMEKKMQNIRMVNISNNGNLISCSTNATFLTFYGIRNDSSCGRGTRKSKTTIVLAVVLPIFFLIVIFAFLILAYRRRRKLWAPKLLRFSRDCSSQGGPYKFQTDAKEWVVDVKLPTAVPVLIFDRPLTKISFADLLIATSNFSRQSLLVEENSGPVYAGYLLEGHPVAIKVLVNGLSLSDQEVADELERLAQIKHQNLVQLLGYCFAGRQRIVLYDYNMQNGTLRDLLHKVSDYREHGKNFSLEDEKYEVEEMTNDGQVQNTWEFRHKIALGVARGLAFLHHGCSPSIIHGFVKAHSVLLDSNLQPRLSDYALYRLTSIKFQDDNPFGSPGYMAEATAESDVYDFGILLFELLTGKQAYDDQNPGLSADNNLVKWVRGLTKKDMLLEAIDAKIKGTGPEKQMEEALKIGYLCTADIPSKRPSMKQVVGLLKDIEPNVENNGT